MTRDDRAISQWDDHSPNIEGETNPFWLYIYTVPVYYNIYIYLYTIIMIIMYNMYIYIYNIDINHIYI